MAHILIVEDDQAVADEIAAELRLHHHTVTMVANGAEALRIALQGGFDAITLDRMIPDLDGLSLVSAMRAEGVRTPVLMISALGDVDDRVAGIRAGGDDYLIKPFAPAEMSARVDGLLRRTAAGVPETLLKAGALTLDLLARTVDLDGQPVKLYPTEFKLLEFFVRNKGRCLTRRFIFQEVWGYQFDPGTNAINVHVARLRHKLDRPGRPPLIATVKGEGYQLDDA